MMVLRDYFILNLLIEREIQDVCVKHGVDHESQLAVELHHHILGILELAIDFERGPSYGED